LKEKISEEDNEGGSSKAEKKGEGKLGNDENIVNVKIVNVEETFDK
jgi:hypothetical protein